MCNSVIFEGREYGTPRELAGLLGGESGLVWQTKNSFRQVSGGRDWRDLDLCLCGVDLEATLVNAGLRWRRGDDPMEYFASRKN